MSVTSAKAIQCTLEASGHTVKQVCIRTSFDLEDFIEQPDLVFSGLKYVEFDNKREWVGDTLETNSFLYTGSNTSAMKLELNKYLAKKKFDMFRVPTAKSFCIASTEEAPRLHNLQYPVFIKPSSLGGGEGIDVSSVARNHDQYIQKVQSLKDTFNCDVLVEEYLPGREFSVAILYSKITQCYEAFPVELSTPINSSGDRILGSRVKRANKESITIVKDSVLKEVVSRVALEAFASIGGRDFGRVDMRLSGDGTPKVLEINLIPSLIEGYGTFGKSLQLNKNIGYDEMIARIVSLAFDRKTQTLELSTR